VSHSAVAWGHRSGRDRASGLTSRSFRSSVRSEVHSHGVGVQDQTTENW
jgi:hypothetical protein